MIYKDSNTCVRGIDSMIVSANVHCFLFELHRLATFGLVALLLSHYLEIDSTATFKSAV